MFSHATKRNRKRLKKPCLENAKNRSELKNKAQPFFWWIGMFPGMGKMNPKQMQGMLKQFGIKTEEVPAKRVIFEFSDKRIVIEEPTVTAMVVQGQKTFTVMGKETEENTGVLETDIRLVQEQTGASEQNAKSALEETNGDIAEAIVKLKK